jgi:hypothetical protein
MTMGDWHIEADTVSECELSGRCGSLALEARID